MSGNLRRLIGSTKRHLLRYLVNCDHVFNDYSLSFDNTNLSSLDDDQLLDFVTDATEARNKIVEAYTKLTSMNDEWNDLILHDASETATYDNYIAQYGDYHLPMKKAADTLSTLDTVLNHCDDECEQRRLEQPITRSPDSFRDDAPSSDNDLAFWKTPLQVIQNQLSGNKAAPLRAPSPTPRKLYGRSNSNVDVNHPSNASFASLKVDFDPHTGHRNVTPLAQQAPATRTAEERYSSNRTGPSNQIQAVPRTQVPAVPTPPPPHATLYPVPTHPAPPLFNFVDASLLSKMDLPSFSGNLLEWPEFWARFSSLVGDKSEVDPSTKFYILRSCLRGDALMSIDGLSANDRDYAIAVEILKSHYDDKPTIRHMIFTKLMMLPDCDPNGTNLPQLYNRMFSLIRQYSALGDDSKEYGLGAALLNKLPKYVKSRIYDRCHNRNLTPKELIDILTDIVRKERTLLEMDPSLSRHQVSVQQTFQATARPVRQKGSHGTPHRNSSRERQYAPHCQLCDSSQHKVFDCTTYADGHQRSKRAKEKRLCLNCLRPGHQTNQCPSKISCRKCSRRHHTSLCYANNDASPYSNSHVNAHRPPRHGTLSAPQAQPNRSTPRRGHVQFNDQSHFVDDSPAAPAPFTQTTEMSQTYASTYPETPNPNVLDGHQVVLMCAPVVLFNPNDPTVRVSTTAFLDSGSTKSYITKELAAALHLSFDHKEDLHMHTFGSDNPNVFEASIHQLGLYTHDGSHMFLNVRALKTLTTSMQLLQLDGHTTDMTTSDTVPGLLVGSDYFWELVLSDKFCCKQLSNGYRLLHTRIGPIITGKKFKHEYTYSFVNEEKLENPGHHKYLEKLVENFWKFETVGIMDNPCQDDDDKCLQLFNATVTFDDVEGRYSVSLPFKVDPKELPSNYKLAFSRLIANVRMLSRNQTYMSKYHAIITEQLERGIIEAIDVTPDTLGTHFLAHHGVVKNDSKTTKIRCVYDGSAKTKGSISINEALFRGPVLLPDLPGILLRARLSPILVSSDIEKAFLMVGLNTDSRNFTCFLWLKNPSLGCTADNIVIYRFRRVPFGLNVSPFLLAATIHFHLESTGTTIAQAILKNTYVDNVFLSVNSTEEGKMIYHASRELFQKAGMNLREFTSSDRSLNDYFTSQTKDKIDVETKILGLRWNTSTDELSITPPRSTNEVLWTKRKILKFVASTFDPLGWISPSVLIGKMFLQSLWKHNLSWDEQLPDQLANTWRDIISKWTVSSVSLPRCIKLPDDNTSNDLHVFTDASKDAYCAVIYLVQRNSDTGSSSSTLLMSKTRLSPQSHTVTIPRLELAGITIGSQLLRYVTTQLDVPIQNTYLWSDSRVALMWIKIDKDLPVFVKNRVRTIKSNAPTAQLRHVPGGLNPADIASRGMNIEELLSTDIWWKGPPFLLQPPEEWPADKSADVPPPTINGKIDDIVPDSSDIVMSSLHSTPPMLEVTNYSSWTRLLNTVMYIFLFCRLTRRSDRTEKLHNAKFACYPQARLFLFRTAQENNPPSSTLREQLQLYLCKETNVIRAHGRLQHSTLPVDTIKPVFLPKNNHITALYILDLHFSNNHCGVAQTVSEARKAVWIPQIRTVVKRVLRSLCFRCRRVQAKPFSLPDFPPLPAIRVTRPRYPFENTGIDYMGPLFYREGNNAVNKYWIVLLTCLNCRAIYCDIVTDMTSRSLLHLLRRFIASSGFPKLLLADNAKVFKSISELQSSLSSHGAEEGVLDYCALKGINFKFIPSYSPWQGGVYERLVGIFKKSFKAAVANRILPLDDLQTLLKESEAICNSRPLTYVSDQLDHLPLRPIDFIRPFALLSSPRLLIEDSDTWNLRTTTNDALLHDWRRTTSLLNEFWRRWSSEYLTGLRERYKISHPRPRIYSDDTPRKGDIVIIEEEHTDRGQWKIAEVYDSNDNFVRSAQLRLPSKRIITRPINQLYKLEVDVHHAAGHPEKSTLSKHDAPSTGPLQQQTSPAGPISEHPMITRGRGQTTAAMLSLMTIISLFCSIEAVNMKCSTDLSTAKTIIYTTACVSTGAAISTYFRNGAETFCWFPVSCPDGHVAEYPIQPNASLCGAPCACPSWTHTCSHNNGERRHTGAHELSTTLRTYKPPTVCSFTSNSSCDTVKRLGVFNQIQLYDNTTFLVPSLQVDLKDFLDSMDFECFDLKGKPVPAEPPFIGTSQFCAKHNCQDNFNKFCIYGNPIALFEDSDNPAQVIVIQAWGTTTREYYGFIHQVQQDHPVTANCTTRGISLAGPAVMDNVKACVNSYCVFLSNYTRSEITFPNHVTLFDYQVEVEVWMNSQVIHNGSVRCHNSPFCDTLDCSLCLEKIFNVDCWSVIDAVIYAITLCVLLITCCIVRLIHTVCSSVCYIAQGIFNVFRCCCVFFTGCCYRRSREVQTRSHRTYPAFKRRKMNIDRSQKLDYLVISSCLLHCVVPIFPCSEVVSMTANADECVVSQSNTSECTFNQATTLSLQPLNQETCLSLRDDSSEPLGFLSIRVKGIEYVCNQRDEFYTRDHQFLTESSHRCASKGSCTSGRCGSIKPNDRLEEFSHTANHSPGYTSCEDSCGCITCDGCFLCSPSCQFQRLYGSPTSQTTYRVYTCTSWTLSVKLHLSIQNKNNDRSTSLTLYPGTYTRWNNMKFSLISTTSPVLPVLSSTFLTDGKTTSMIKPVEMGHLLPHSPGQLQCVDKQHAADFNCSFPPQVCSCRTASHKSVCNCAKGDIRAYLQKNTLPLTMRNVLIYPEGELLKAQATAGSSLQVQVVAENMKLRTVQHNVTCQVTVSDVTGCYRCSIGAEVHIGCTAAEEVTADITCGEHTNLLVCTHTGKINKVKFSFDRADVHENCSIRCPGGTVFATVEGKLRYINEGILTEMTGSSNRNMISDSDSFSIFGSLNSWIASLTLGTISNYALILTAVLGMLYIALRITIYFVFPPITFSQTKRTSHISGKRIRNKRSMIHKKQY